MRGECSVSEPFAAIVATSPRGGGASDDGQDAHARRRTDLEDPRGKLFGAS